MPADPLFWAVAIIAVIVVGLSKSGLIAALGMVGVPLLTLVMPPREAAGMMLPVLLSMDVIAVWSYRRDINLDILRVMLPGALLGIGIGWALSSVVSDELVMLVLGIITLVFVLDAWLGLRQRLAVPSDNNAVGGFWGAVAGFTSFISHAGGPPFQIYTLPKRMEPRLYAGTAAWFFATVNTVKLVPYFFLGQISVSSLQVSAMLIPVGMLAVAAGIWLIRRISLTLFYKIAYVGIALIALKLIWDGIAGLG